MEDVAETLWLCCLPLEWNHETLELGGTSRGQGLARGLDLKGSSVSVGIGQNTAA